ncbi:MULTISPECIES: N-formylglutamate amidohydrolase [Sphingobacterium]|mgnify:FL=1|uniref:N-formylglutamate amidohydrolase n=2 Tax=Sphingobacterium TaxID=28453 RepID=UPI001627A83C|nr:MULTISPECIES: N-formylglutamate amidohydrolase [Sphingobacterium]MBV2227308.1 N-formylglutamate amidohydrolase [Sphingobacterium mizutaii]
MDLLFIKVEKIFMAKFTKYFIKRIDSPFWAFAIHDGQQIDPFIDPYINLNESERLREEDPFTAVMAELPMNQFIVGSSRFQLDLNRKIEDSVYLRPDQAWGLQVWKDSLPENIVTELYLDHKNIYQEIEEQIQETIDQYGYFVVYDIHSYNAKRNGSEEEVDTEINPQINLGTAYVDPKWQPLIDQLMGFISKDSLYDGPIDIRENIKFKGGYLSQLINKKFGAYGCVLSIEFRKDFMDEWTGAPDLPRVVSCKQLLMNSIQVLKQYFKNDSR